MAQSSHDQSNQRVVVAFEDERGVDVAQIRAQLRLTVPERVRTMVEIANAKIAMQEAAKTQSVVD